MSLTSLMIRPETLKAHQATWFVWSGGEKMRRTSKMMGTWGYDVTCSCGWQSRTGGATKRSVEDALFDHRYDAQIKADMEADALTLRCTDCGSQPSAPCTCRGEALEHPHAVRVRDAALKSQEESRS